MRSVFARPRTYFCDDCGNDDFLRGDGFFEPLGNEPAYRELRARITEENAASLARYEEQFGMLASIRAQMASANAMRAQ